jgi:hypothetical protein
MIFNGFLRKFIVQKCNFLKCQKNRKASSDEVTEEIHLRNKLQLNVPNNYNASTLTIHRNSASSATFFKK